MERQVKHILLCGSRRTGRSSMVRKLTEASGLPLCGFMTRTLNKREDGYHEIYMFPYGAQELRASEDCHIGDCNTRERVIHNEVFNTLGVKLLEPKPGAVLVMDEVGFMESQADAFCDAVIARLGSDTPVIAAVRTSIDTPFIQKVLASENALVVRMDPARFDDIYAELLPVVSSWKTKVL